MLTIEKAKTDDGTAVLRLQGEVTIENADQLRDALLEGLKQESRVRLDCEKISVIDFYGIQMICSAHHSSVAWDKTLSWQGPLPEVAREAIRRTGFARHHSCNLCPEGVSCLWT
jgi:anti-anti-sigma factor